jgi:hypothetical protein
VQIFTVQFFFEQKLCIAVKIIIFEDLCFAGLSSAEHEQTPFMQNGFGLFLDVGLEDSLDVDVNTWRNREGEILLEVLLPTGG